MQDFFNQFLASMSAVTLTTVVRLLLTVIVGLLAVKYLTRLCKRILARTKLDAGLQMFAASAVKGMLIFVFALICTDQLGMNITSLITLLGVFGLAVSLALQDSLANLAGGIFVIGTKPFGVGDFIEVSGVSGTVAAIGLIHTVLNTVDNTCIYLPNGSVSKEKIKNFSHEENRQVEMLFPIGYHCDTARAREIIEQTVLADSRTLAEPAPFVRVWELGHSSVNIIARAWTKNGNFMELKCSLLERVKCALDKEGITIAYNQLEVTMKK